MHEKPSLIMLFSAKQETSHLLGADAEERQARQLIMHRNQEQYTDLKDPSVSGFFRFLAKIGDGMMKMQIVKINF